MKLIDEYRKMGRRCRELASEASSASRRDTILLMSEIWDALATERERDLQAGRTQPVTDFPRKATKKSN